MNTNTGEGPVVSLSPESQRAADWLKVFGRLERVPVTKFLPAWVSVPGRSKVQAYELDLKRVTTDERVRLVQHIAERFGYSFDEVAASLDEEGVPLLAEDTMGPAIPLRLLI